MKYLLFFILFLYSMLIYAQDNACSLKNISFDVGENLEYRVGYYLLGVWVKAGVVNFSVKDSAIQGKQYYHFLAKGHTLPKYDWVFKVRDTYESLLDIEQQKPIMFHRDVSEGSHQQKDSVFFDFDHLTATSQNGAFEIDPCTFDVVSAVYYCRNINWDTFEVRDTVPLNLFLDDSSHQVYVRYLGKDEIKTDFGTFRTIKFSPLLIEGTMFEAGEQMTVWVTDDENKMPLKVVSPILVGSVRAEIYAFEGLKAKLTSKIDIK